MSVNLKIKKGMSLITVVITIIMITILASTIILTMSNSGIIENANKAKEHTNKATINTYLVVLGNEWELLDDSRREDYHNSFEEYADIKIKEKGLISDSNKMLYYGISRKLSSSSSKWARLGNAGNLVANATKNGVTTNNDFDNIYPWSNIITYNYDVIRDRITAYYGDSNFKFDGTNGEVLTKIPEFYYKRIVEDGYEYIYISEYHLPGYKKSEEFSVGRYKSSEKNNVCHSISGQTVSANKTITQHRNMSKALSNKFCQMDYRYFMLQMLYLVEYADYNAQEVLGNGWTKLPYTSAHIALMSESNTNRIIVASNYASLYQVGYMIDIGKTQGGRQIARDRKITKISDYNNGSITGKAIYFDGTAVNVSEGNMLYCCGQKTGSCDSLGMKSGSVGTGVGGNEGVIYRGVEDFFGNVFEWVDGINIRNYQAYVCTNPKEYASDKFDGAYNKLGYIIGTTSGYIKTLGYDDKNPEFALPTSTGAMSKTNLCDYYYISKNDNTTCVGGYASYDQSAGPFCWIAYYNSSHTNFNRGSRLIKYQ